MTYEYDVRPTARKIRHTFRLTEEHLEVEQGEDALRLPYAQVTGVLIGFAGAGKLRCQVVPASGKSVTLVSHEYASVGRFKSRLDRMVPFVDELNRRLTLHAGGIRFRFGSPGFYWFCFGCLIGLVLMFVGMGVALARGMLDETSTGVIFMVTTALVGLLVLGMTVGARPRPFQPDQGVASLVRGEEE